MHERGQHLYDMATGVVALLNVTHHSLDSLPDSMIIDMDLLSAWLKEEDAAPATSEYDVANSAYLKSLVDVGKRVSTEKDASILSECPEIVTKTKAGKLAAELLPNISMMMEVMALLPFTSDQKKNLLIGFKYLLIKEDLFHPLMCHIFTSLRRLVEDWEEELVVEKQA